jgi:hypothetical protein
MAMFAALEPALGRYRRILDLANPRMLSNLRSTGCMGLSES